MAFVVVFSTLSFTVESHYCGSYLIDTAVFSKAKHCGMESSATTTIKKSCCKDEIIVVEGQDELKLNTLDSLKLNQQLFFTSFIYSYASLFESLPRQVIPHKEYIPPNLFLDIQVRDETFLI